MKTKQSAAKSKATAVKLSKVDVMDDRGEKVAEFHYKITEMTGAIVLDDKWRVGDSLTEEEAVSLSKDTTVIVGS